MNVPSGQRQRLAAILAADAVGYSRLMAHDEQATVAALDAARTVFRTTIAAHDGRVIDTAGDSVLAVFETAAGAVTAAIAVQQGLEALDEGLPADRRMRFRIGVHMGDVIEKADGTVYGDGVNIAARLEGLAQPGGIVVSDAVHGAVRNRVAATFDDLGDQRVKNIADPVHAYGVRSNDASGVDPEPHTLATRAGWRSWRFSGRPVLAGGLTVLVLVAGAATYLKLERSGPNNWQARAPSLTILPFKAPAGLENEQFASEFTLGLNAALGKRLYGWNFVAADSVSGRGAAQIRTPESGAAVHYLVDGEVRRSVGKTVVDARFLDAQTRSQLWAGRMEIEESGLLRVPELLLARTTNSVRSALWSAETKRVARMSVDDLGPVDLVNRSYVVEVNENFWTAQAIQEMLNLCDAALRREPGFVPALVCKADAMLAPFDQIGAEANPALLAVVDDLTNRAVSSAPNYFDAWITRASALRFQGKWAAALEASQRAIFLDQSAISPLTFRSFLVIWAGTPEEVFPLTARLLDIDPAQAGFAAFAQCEAYVLMGKFDDAIATCERAASEDPHWMVHIALAAAYAHKGDLDKAAAARDKAISRQPKLTLSTFRASRKLKADTPKQWELYDKTWEPGLRLAGLREN